MARLMFRQGRPLSITALAAAVSAALCSGGSALAQGPAQFERIMTLEEIIVTVQRRPTSLQRTAVAVDVVSGEAVAAQGVTDLQRLADLSPGLLVSASAGSYVSPTVRGVNNFAVNYFSEAATAINLNGTYLSRPSVNSFFFDLEQIEIAKGPQGTLYGRNATGGAINVITRLPTMESFGGYVNADVGDYNTQVITAALNMPLGEATAVRLAGHTAQHEGYFSDDTGDQDVNAGRLSLLTRFSDAVSLSLVADYSQHGGKGVGSTRLNLDGSFSGDPWQGLLDQLPAVNIGPAVFPLPQRPFRDDEYGGVAGELQWAGDAGTFTLNSGYRTTDTNFLNTTLGFFILERSEADQTTVEARFASPDERRLRYVVGVYYFAEDIDGQGYFDQTQSGVTFQDYMLGTDSYAAYGQLGFSLTERLRLTLGARYTAEEKTVDGAAFRLPRFVPGVDAIPPPIGGPTVVINGASEDFNATTWTAGIELDVGEDSLLYANVATGFKSGGFFSAPVGGNTYEPEDILAYTLGSKNLFFNGRLQANAEVFYYEYTDQQVSHLDQRFLPGNIPLIVQATENVGAATIKGADLSLDWLAAARTTISLHESFLVFKIQWHEFLLT